MYSKKILSAVPGFFVAAFLLVLIPQPVMAQDALVLFADAGKIVRPLDTVKILCKMPGIISVKDSKGRVYQRMKAQDVNTVIAGGAAGKQTISLLAGNGKLLGQTYFTLAPVTTIDDGGQASELFSLLYKGMHEKENRGYGEIKHGSRVFRSFEFWDLDNNNIMNGMQYAMPYGSELTDLLRETQREDGMIWSFIESFPGHEGLAAYYETAYGPINFYRRKEDIFLVRQPVDNHSDFNFVTMFYKQWKASGDDAWMKKTLPAAAKALDYCYNDSIRWSKRFQLLKRPYCIDSWDFQIDDEYTPPAPVSPTMVVVPGKTKYGVFFGDNTGYFDACNQLAEMYEHAADKNKAAVYRNRGQAVLKNLMALAWNGKYFTHFIDEDSTVKRNLGIDERSQVAQSNMYSLNRGLPHEVNKAIIETYLKLKDNLPEGSPGEWYAIYPPFEKGFTIHDAKWQYMNGGVAGHAIGELVRGAFENGYEKYAVDIMYRTHALIKKHGDKLWFAYTGSIPSPLPAPAFKTIDISSFANMNLWDAAAGKVFSWMNGKRAGNDMRSLPVGEQVFNSVKFMVTDPAKNNTGSAVALSVAEGFPKQIDIPVNDTAGAVYLLHTISDGTPKNTAGSVTFVYSDGTSFSKYLIKGKDITNWWFADLKTDQARVAWYGPNPVSARVGVCQTVIDNPFPAKKIASLRLNASLEAGIYAVLGVTLSNRKFYNPPSAESFGGPDYWASANAMAGLVEGLAGVKNEGLGFSKVKLSPRWTSAGTDSVNVTIRFAASGGYVSYQYRHLLKKKQIALTVTGSGDQLKAHVLLPAGIRSVKSVTAGDTAVKFTINTIEQSFYADFELPLPAVQTILINYDR